jgi:hypothetical protein
MEFYQLKVCEFRITGCGNACRAAVLPGLVRTGDTIGSGRKKYLFRSQSSCTVRKYETRSSWNLHNPHTKGGRLQQRPRAYQSKQARERRTV